MKKEDFYSKDIEKSPIMKNNKKSFKNQAPSLSATDV